MWYNYHFTTTCFGSEYMPILKPFTLKWITSMDFFFNIHGSVHRSMTQ